MAEQEKIDWVARVEAARLQAQKYTKPNGKPELLNAYGEMLYALSHLVDEYVKTEREYEVKPYIEEMFPYAHHAYEYEHMKHILCNAFCNLPQATRWHPRLRVQVLEMYDKAHRQVTSRRPFGDTTEAEIWAGQRNIKLADIGVTDIRYYHTPSRVDMIDPIEWTLAWDEVIDTAVRKTYAVLPKSKEKRGDNFQERFYEKLANILQEDHGITWRTPDQMKKVEEKLAQLPNEERHPKPDPLDAFMTTRERASKAMGNITIDRLLTLGEETADEEAAKARKDYWDAHLYHIDCCIAVTQDRRDEARLQPYTEVIAAIKCGLSTIEFLRDMASSVEKAVLYEKLRVLYEASQQVYHPRLSETLINAMYLLARRADYTVGDKDWLEAEERHWVYNLSYAHENRPTRIKPHPNDTYLRDSVEWSSKWEKVIDKVDEQVEQELGIVHPNRSSYGVREWTVRARILEEKYDILWLSPKDLNPDMTFNE